MEKGVTLAHWMKGLSLIDRFKVHGFEVKDKDESISEEEVDEEEISK